jgi:hypothetical protein
VVDGCALRGHNLCLASVLLIAPEAPEHDASGEGGAPSK